MPRNLSCGCLCHGSSGNRIGDEYFSCGNCYAANHMSALPRLQPAHKTKPASKGPRKPRVLKPTSVVVNAAVKTVAKVVMENIAVAAESITAEEIKDAVK